MSSREKGLVNGKKCVSQCVGPYCWLVSQPTVPLFAAVTSGVSLSCHYRQTSHGYGVVSQRQDRRQETEGAVWMREREMRGGDFPPLLFLLIKGFWGTAQRKLLSAEFKDILLKLLKCLCAHAASRLHMWTVR